jgi:hypothetical protein
VWISWWSVFKIFVCNTFHFPSCSTCWNVFWSFESKMDTETFFNFNVKIIIYMTTTTAVFSLLRNELNCKKNKFWEESFPMKPGFAMQCLLHFPLCSWKYLRNDVFNNRFRFSSYIEWNKSVDKCLINFSSTGQFTEPISHAWHALPHLMLPKPLLTPQPHPISVVKFDVKSVIKHLIWAKIIKHKICTCTSENDKKKCILTRFV